MQTWPFCTSAGGCHAPWAEASAFLSGFAGPNDSFLARERLCVEGPPCGENPEPLESLGTASPFTWCWVLSCMEAKRSQLPEGQGSADLYIFIMLAMNTPYTSAGRGGQPRRLGELKSRKWVTDTGLPDRTVVVRKIRTLIFKRIRRYKVTCRKGSTY